MGVKKPFLERLVWANYSSFVVGTGAISVAAAQVLIYPLIVVVDED